MTPIAFTPAGPFRVFPASDATDHIVFQPRLLVSLFQPHQRRDRRGPSLGVIRPLVGQPVDRSFNAAFLRSPVLPTRVYGVTCEYVRSTCSPFTRIIYYNIRFSVRSDIVSGVDIAYVGAIYFISFILFYRLRYCGIHFFVYSRMASFCILVMPQFTINI